MKIIDFSAGTGVDRDYAGIQIANSIHTHTQTHTFSAHMICMKVYIQTHISHTRFETLLYSYLLLQALLKIMKIIDFSAGTGVGRDYVGMQITNSTHTHIRFSVNMICMKVYIQTHISDTQCKHCCTLTCFCRLC